MPSAEHKRSEPRPGLTDAKGIDSRLGEIEAALAAFEDLPVTFDPAEVERAGAFVSIGPDGRLLVQRGFIRPEDELPVAELEPDPGTEISAGAAVDEDQPVVLVAMRVDDGGMAVQAGSVPEPRRCRALLTRTSRARATATSG